LAILIRLRRLFSSFQAGLREMVHPLTDQQVGLMPRRECNILGIPNPSLDKPKDDIDRKSAYELGTYFYNARPTLTDL